MLAGMPHGLNRGECYDLDGLHAKITKFTDRDGINWVSYSTYLNGAWVSQPDMSLEAFRGQVTKEGDKPKPLPCP
jgi:hypothetical protein